MVAYFALNICPTLYTNCSLTKSCNTYILDNTSFYYPTALRRVQIMPKKSTNITQYLYSRGPVRQVFSQSTNDELD